jgi:regulator of protease activity HflC (stomatin/prohibitin superfamily)
MIVFVLIIIVLILLGTTIRIVPQATSWIIERMGIYRDTWDVGVHFMIPFVDRVAKKVSLKERVIDFPPQPVITKDNVTMQIDTVVYYQVTVPKLFLYGIENPLIAIENLTATTLRNIIGELELDETLTSRDIINSKMRTQLDVATDPWGVKVNRVEVKNIIPPKEIQNAMEKQMKAERERREAILRAEGEKNAAVLRAEGEKQSAILHAEAQKIEMVREAEGHADAIRLHKEAEAAGIKQLKEAEAEGIRILKEAGLTTEQIVKLRSLEAFTAAADGKATKIIIPSDIQSIAGLVEGVKEATSK